MQLQTLLNYVEKHKSFVYGKVTWTSDFPQPALEVRIVPRANGRPICSGCGRPGPGYDRLAERRFEYVPLWQISVFFLYALRRVNCRRCGVTVERVPWADGKQTQTKTYRWFLAQWAKRLSWQEVATIFGTSWQSVFRAVRFAVFWGLVHRELKGIHAMGVDEIQWRRGHKYLTLVYQLDQGAKRLLWIGRERTADALRGFFRLLGPKQIAKLRFVVSDMWQPYVDVIHEQAGHAINILDRYHVMAQMNKALDEVRAAEAKRLKQDGYEPILKHSRWCLLKRPENLTDAQTVKLSELLKYNLQSVRAYLQRADFQRFWQYESPTWAGKFLDEWCRRVLRSRIGPMQRVARTLRSHRELLLNWFQAHGTLSAGIVEGFNNKAKLTIRKSYGFRTDQAIEIALYHNLADLPEPEFTHRFW